MTPLGVLIYETLQKHEQVLTRCWLHCLVRLYGEFRSQVGLRVANMDRVLDPSDDVLLESGKVRSSLFKLVTMINKVLC